jgi:hypothetical protein
MISILKRREYSYSSANRQLSLPKLGSATMQMQWDAGQISFGWSNWPRIHTMRCTHNVDVMISPKWPNNACHYVTLLGSIGRADTGCWRSRETDSVWRWCVTKREPKKRKSDSLVSMIIRVWHFYDDDHVSTGRIKGGVHAWGMGGHIRHGLRAGAWCRPCSGIHQQACHAHDTSGPPRPLPQSQSSQQIAGETRGSARFRTSGAPGGRRWSPPDPGVAPGWFSSFHLEWAGPLAAGRWYEALPAGGARAT